VRYSSSASSRGVWSCFSPLRHSYNDRHTISTEQRGARMTTESTERIRKSNRRWQSISYGPLGSDPSFTMRCAAYFVDKLLKGAKVAELPIEQPTKFSLAINLKTAKTLSLEIPPSPLGRADEVIE
jgi:hypothetical protein